MYTEDAGQYLANCAQYCIALLPGPGQPFQEIWQKNEPLESNFIAWTQKVFELKYAIISCEIVGKLYSASRFLRNGLINTFFLANFRLVYSQTLSDTHNSDPYFWEK